MKYLLYFITLFCVFTAFGQYFPDEDVDNAIRNNDTTFSTKTVSYESDYATVKDFIYYFEGDLNYVTKQKLTKNEYELRFYDSL